MSRTALALIVAFTFTGSVAAGDEVCLEHLGEPVGLADVASGTLLYRTSDLGAFVPAPAVAMEVSIAVRGLLAETTVRQHFANPTDEWLEGVYAFPLPAGAAVHSMRLAVGDRIIEGRIRERSEASRAYRRAAAEGRAASLVEQERPNLFTTSVTNVRPGASVEVEISYQESLRWDDAVVELAFPMVVGPRFVPGGFEADSGGPADAARIAPPVAHPDAGALNPVRLRVLLDAGFELVDLVSPYHPVEVRRQPDGTVLVSLADGEVPADRDFVLRWRVARGRDPLAAVFTEQWEGSTYVLAVVVPPAEEYVGSGRLPRETVLVVDTSGSMQGASIEQARAALEHALERLHPEDLFNVIRFANRFERLFPDSRPAMPATLDHARDWIRQLQADGGTNMAPALSAALAEGELSAPVRQVVFVTDGCVGNEDQLFALIERELGRSRLFTVGIGSAPNRYFMESAAAFGRGTFTFIGAGPEVAAAMDGLFARLEDPVLADLELAWPDPGAEVWPRRLPDLYAGEPLVVAARLGTIAGELALDGVRAGRGWHQRVPLEIGEPRGGVHRLWARRKIASLEAERARGAPDEQVREAALAVALEHGLVSRYTSLVAVDVTPSRPQGDALRGAPVPTSLPHGWQWQGTVGAMPATGAGWTLRLLAGAAAALVGWLAWRRAWA